MGSDFFSHPRNKGKIDMDNNVVRIRGSDYPFIEPSQYQKGRLVNGVKNIGLIRTVEKTIIPPMVQKMVPATVYLEDVSSPTYMIETIYVSDHVSVAKS